MGSNALDYRELLRAGRWFSGLPAAVADRLLDVATLASLDAGATLFASDSPPDGIYAVVDGAVRLTGRSGDGREVIHLIAEPPSWFGEVSVLDGLPRRQRAVVDQDARIVHVGQRQLEELLAAEPGLWRHLGVLSTSKLRLALLAMEDLAFASPIMRLARRLVLMTEGYGDWRHRKRRVLAIRQDQLGQMLGVSRQTVNQLLGELARDGLIRPAYGEIEIVDLERLRRCAG